jgi:hypothetical protein
VKFKSALMTAGSGKLRGIVASHNKGGSYLRGLTIPTNPRSSFQTTVRNNLSVLQTRFLTTVTSVQRAAWAVYAENTPVTDALGDSIKLSANQWYVALNSLRLQAGVATIDAGPTTFGLATMTAPVATIVAAGTTVSLAFTNTDAWANEVGGYLLLYASRPQNATINFFKGPFRFAGKVAGAGTPPTTPATITLPFVIGPATSKMFFRAVAVRADGRKSIDLFLSATA